MVSLNWLGKLVQREIGKHDSVLDLGCGTMQATLDTCPTYSKKKLKCKFIVGVDIYRNYLEVIKNRDGVAVLHMDVSKPLSIFLDKSFDIVLLLDIVEHLERDGAEQLIFEAERIARKKVIVRTPKVFRDNVEATKEVFPYCGLGDNPYQRHRCCISPEWFIARDYLVRYPPPDSDTHIFAVKLIGRGS